MKTVLVLYGGVSTEHEVAIITALQVMNALKEGGYRVIPGYVSKQGRWFFGDERFLKPEFYKSLESVENNGVEETLTPDRGIVAVKKTFMGYKKPEEKIDVIFPVFHGRNGEDGSMAGFLNLLNLPYVGCQVGAGAVAMDKYMSKVIAKNLGIETAKDVLVQKGVWQKSKKKIMAEIKDLGLPLFVKPNSLGSSIGISKVKKWEELEDAIEVGLAYDQRVLVEAGIEDPKEVNISIMGNGPYEVSITEQPVAKGEILSFEDKYVAENKKTEGMASADRYMPAKVDAKIIKEVEESAKKFFEAIGGKGIARIDFMVDKNNRVYFNEINPMPGSIAFYLWEKSGLSIADLVKKLVNLAIEDWSEKQKLVTMFESNILAGYASRGVKGKKQQ